MSAEERKQAGSEAAGEAESAGEDSEVLDDEPRNILSGLIAQLRKGMDLHRVTLPTFVLEPRSMTERITDFMSHPQLIHDTSLKDDPVARFVDVLRYYLSGWHIKPKGVRKPYNPILGEHFRCRWQFQDGTEALFVSEQVSHHPPISAYYYASPENNLMVVGEMRPKSKFLGNSAATMMEGLTHIEFTNRPGEEYVVSLPTVYVRGILFGTMVMELGDPVTLRCEKTDLMADIDFKTKGFFSGSYNHIGGKVKRISTSEVLYELSGKWTDVMYIKKGGQQEVFFDAHDTPICAKIVAREEQQHWNESRKLWSKVTAAIVARNLDLATEEKSRIEDAQRHVAKEREAEGIDWTSKYFVPVGNEWRFRLHHTHNGKLPADPAKAKKEIMDTIWSADTPEIPAQHRET